MSARASPQRIRGVLAAPALPFFRLWLHLGGRGQRFPGPRSVLLSRELPLFLAGAERGGCPGQGRRSPAGAAAIRDQEWSGALRGTAASGCARLPPTRGSMAAGMPGAGGGQTAGFPSSLGRRRPAGGGVGARSRPGSAAPSWSRSWGSVRGGAASPGCRGLAAGPEVGRPRAPWDAFPVAW